MKFVRIEKEALKTLMQKAQELEQVLSAIKVETIEKKWLTPAELRQYIRVSPTTLRKWAEKGLIPAKREGRNYLYDIDGICKILNDNLIPAKK